MLNKVILIGRLGKDPEYRNTTNGTALAKASLATSEKYNGEAKTTWHNLVFFGKLSEIATRYLTKGSLVYIEGKIQHSVYDSNGETKTFTEIVVNQMQMLGGKSDQQPNQQQPNQQQQQQVGSYHADDDLPF